MWKLYDELIEGIPENLTVDEMASGIFGTVVKSGSGCGFSLSLEDITRPFGYGKQRGMKLKDLASFIKSWNFVEASFGQAAINAYYNSPETAEANGLRLSSKNMAEGRLSDPFIMYQNKIKEKNVVVVGHFPYIEQLFAPVCQMSIVETDPQDGDFPDQAAEYLLSQCDFAFITGKSLINKSLPRYLKACTKAQAQVILVGPSTPLAPCLFKHGISDLSGIVVFDAPLAFDICCGIAKLKIYRAAHKVSLKHQIS